LDRTVEGYLAELKGQLAGADPALVQDALYDAEEYLRSAMAEEGDDPAQAFDRAAEAYGTPEEVASSYREAELAVVAALRRPAPAKARSVAGGFFSVLSDPSAWGGLLYMLLGIFTGTLYFTLCVTGISLSLGLAILIIGLPVALLFLAMVRAVSLVEGRVVEGLLGVRMPRRPRFVGGQGDIWTRIKWWLTDYRTWTTILYMLLQLPLGIFYFTSLVTGFAFSAGLMMLPVEQELIEGPLLVVGRYGYYIEAWAYPLFVLGGLFGLLLLLWYAKGVGKLHGVYAKALLVGRAEDHAQHPAAPGGGVGAAQPPTAPAVPTAGPSGDSSAPTGAQGGDTQ